MRVRLFCMNKTANQDATDDVESVAHILHSLFLAFSFALLDHA